MKLGMVIHRALDYFFCDRCFTEAKLPGRPIEWPDPKFVEFVAAICPISILFKFLPEEKDTPVRRIYFPRSWLQQSKWDEPEDGIRT